MAEIHSAFTLLPVNPPAQFAAKATRMMRAARLAQVRVLQDNAVVDCCSPETSYSSREARALTYTRMPAQAQLGKSRFIEMNRSESYRLLAAYQQRLLVADTLMAHGWNLPYRELCELLGLRIDYELYQNVLRSGKLPSFPKIRNVRLPLNKANAQFSTAPEVQGSVIRLRMIVFDEWMDLKFIIPEKLLERHAEYVKISKPVMRLAADGKILFDFTFIEKTALEVTASNSIGFDLGISRVFTGARHNEMLAPSAHTERDQKALDKLEQEICRLRAKQVRRVQAKAPTKPGAELELERLRRKRKRVIEARDWNAATDIVHHSGAGETIVVEQLSFNTGDRQFRSGSLTKKVQHKAARAGKHVRQVNAAHTSLTCPACHATKLPVKERIISCPSCGYTADRDFAAAQIIQQRGTKLRKAKVKSKTKSKAKAPIAGMKREQVHKPPSRIRHRTFTRVGTRCTGRNLPGSSSSTGTSVAHAGKLTPARRVRTRNSESQQT